MPAWLAGIDQSAIKNIADGAWPLRPAAAAAAVLCLLAGTASAQGTLSEVKVTAEGETAASPANGFVAKRSATGTKTDTPLSETPQSITVVTREQVEAQAADSLDQAFGYSVGIAPLTGGTQRRTGTAFVVRGFNVTGSAPLYLNGSKFPINSLSGAIEPYGYERFELLKGPASILYGQAAPGGIIDLVTKRPTAAPLREIELSVGSWNRKQVAVDLGGPLNADGSLGYRVTGVLRDSNAMISEIPDDRASFNGVLEWKASRDTHLTLLGTWQRDKSLYDYGKPLDGTLLPNRNGAVRRDLFVGEPGFDYFNTRGATLGYLLEHRLNDRWTFRQNLLGFDYEADNSWAGITARTDTVTQRTVARSAVHRDDTDRGWSLDNQLQGRLRTGAAAHTLLAGLDWSDRDFMRAQRTGTVGALDLFSPVYGSPVTLGAASRSVSTARQLGLYVQNQTKLAERWIFLAGARYDEARNDSQSITAAGATTSSTQKSHAFTPRAGVLYKAGGGFSPYYSYTRSFQPTGGTDFFLQQFKPTEGTQHEIGVKWEPEGANASVTLAAYELTQRNVLTSDLAHPGFSTQTGEQRARGVELEGRASLMRRLDLVGGIATTDARITQSNTGTAGTRPTNVPRNMASLWADWRFADELAGLSLGFGVRHVGPTELNRMEVPGYTVYDAALRYQWDKWRFALNVKNLTDRTYLASCSFACFYGDERNMTLTARYSW